ncbi:TetR/AcrR family transcriptional regulator [Streptococcus uberis]|uniref:TetR/AcrR family transcriptional regulator n=1 Tax=Streptococcus uberis TaxID=1349 RepID=UPI001FF44C41|nr:TetR/AcrR family transcriptional regulator [Streptococcus uberis]MCK1226446.1 TetR/AcrR family transcriptional regulator [Streptococcus uberis]
MHFQNYYRKKIEKITVFELCKKANLSRQAFYNHFYTKEDFVKQTIIIVLDKITTILNQDSSLDNIDVIEEMLCFLYQNKRMIQPIAKNFPNIKIIIIIKYITEVVENSEISNLKNRLENFYKLPYDYALDIFSVTIEVIIFNWINNDFKESPKEVAQFIVSAVDI